MHPFSGRSGSVAPDRARAIEQLRAHLLRTSAPRLQMTLVLLLTAGTGFAASVLLLHLGVARMSVRYPAAVLLAYGAFLLLLRVWLAWQRRQGRMFDASPDLPGLELPSLAAGGPGAPVTFGGGGGFGGAGAERTWGMPDQSPRPVVPAARPGAATKSAGRAWDLDLDEGGVVVIPIVAVLGAILASLYVVYVAPALFAELLLDGIVVTALYHRLRTVERRHWLRCVVRRTWIPALLTALLFGVAGHLMQRAVPDAPSIGPFWQAATRR